MLLHAAGMQSWEHYTQKKIYLLANLSFVCGAEGDGTTLPSCAFVNRSINAYRASLCDTLVGSFGMLCGGQRSCHLLFCLCGLFWLRSGTFHCYITLTFTFT